MGPKLKNELCNIGGVKYFQKIISTGIDRQLLRNMTARRSNSSCKAGGPTKV